MTAADIRTLVHRITGESSPLNAQPPVFYSDAEVLAAINSAQRLFAFLSLSIWIESAISFSVTSNFQRLSLPRLIRPLRLRGPAKRIYPSTVAAMEAHGGIAWRARTGTAEAYTVLGSDLLVAYPRRSETLTLLYAASPVAMGVGDTPEIPPEHYHSLAYGAVALLKLKEGGIELQKVLHYWSRFMQDASTCRQWTFSRIASQGFDPLPGELVNTGRIGGPKK